MARWEMYNPSPSGRNVGDCSVRAIAKALNITWVEAYSLIAAYGFSMQDMPSSNAVWGAVLKHSGFKRHVIMDTCPDCYTIGDFADDHPHGTYVVGTGSHVVTVIDGVIYDSWDSANEIPVYYWARKENAND
jgi:hypothetical protein